MFTRKIEDPGIWQSIKLCEDPNHHPPKYQMFIPGRYEHRCPACGQNCWFTVNQPGLIDGSKST